jgi:serine/threonine protein kinase
MTLEAGTRIGRYEVLSQLGRGGMGEVYLAEDTQLHRKVALKTLPGDVAANQDRMRRFNQEATAAAALNHPNIAHIYEIGQQDDVSFIAMEFVDGYTLRQVIHDKQSELGKLLRYLQHTAEGLAKAHAANIVHRDLKPDNIMITREGHPKILDFGLAKLVEPSGLPQGRAGLSEVATALMQQHSTPGSVMGTVGYMSPEQAQGRTDEIDPRSDIFSFGCILYEAVTRQKAFPGKDAIESLNKIIREQPAPISSLTSDAPADLQRVVRRCLAKDPEERYQTIKDVAIELKEVRRELQAGAGVDTTVPPPPRDITTQEGGGAVSTQTAAVSSLSPSSTSTQSSSAEYIASQITRHKTGTMLVLGLVVIGLVGLGYAMFKFLNRNKAATPVAGKMKISRLVTGAGEVGNVSISPDGRYVAYVAYKGDKISLRLRQVSTGSDREIMPALEDATIISTVFSPDGDFVYYNYSQRDKSPLGTLYQVPVIGGREPRKILEHINTIISFAPDGKRFAFIRDTVKTGESALMVASLDGGEPRALLTRAGQDWFEGVPAWSPDGRVIVCSAGTDTGGTQFSLIEVPAEGGPARAITGFKWRGIVFRPTWIKDGSALLVNGSDLPGSPMQIWRVSYPEGAVSRITNDLTEYGSNSFGLTADGSTIVSIATERTSKIWLAAANEEESKARKLTNGKLDGQAGRAIMPDGRVVYVTETAETTDLWIVNPDGSGQRQLTSNDDKESSPEPTADGKYIVFAAQAPAGVPHIFRIDVDGGNIKQLTSGEFSDYSPACSPDGQWVLFLSWRTGKPTMWKVSMDGGDAIQLSDQALRPRHFMPDGKSIFGGYFDEEVSPPRWRSALFSPDSGKAIKVFDFPPKAITQAMPDDHTLLWTEPVNEVDNVWTRPLDGGTPRQVTRFSSDRIFNFAPSADGKRYALVRGTVSADVILIKDFH